jgi:NADPH2:quinone reductase
MRAVVVRRFGPPDVLEMQSLSDPEPGPGEALLEVSAIDVLFFETMLRAGLAPPGMQPQLPWIPGNGIAGRVLAVGAGVDPAWVGGSAAAHTGSRGGYADRAAVAAARMVAIPAGVTASRAASVLHDLPTALTLFDVTNADAASSVLIVGASGGLGLMLGQLAAGAGAAVIAVARGAGKRDRIAAAVPGSVVLDPEDAEWIDRARAALGGAGADVVFDNVGGSLGDSAFELVAPGGRFSAHGTPSGAFARVDRDRARATGVTVTGIEQVQLDDDRLRRATERALAAVADGRCTPVIGQTYPLQRAADAHAAIEARTVFAKTLLTT